MADWRKSECCGTCKYWDLVAVQYKNGAVPEKAYAKCLVEIPTIALPFSVSVRGWDSYEPPKPGHIERDKGKGCPFYERRVLTPPSGQEKETK